MSDQPTALQLAAQLDAEVVRTVEVDMLYHRAAAELRRQHDRIEALEAQVREQALNYLSLDGQAEALVDRIKELEAANEAFGQRQAWWNERMVTLEQKVEADEALLRQALEALKVATLHGWILADHETIITDAIAAIRARPEGRA